MRPGRGQAPAAYIYLLCRCVYAVHPASMWRMLAAECTYRWRRLAHFAIGSKWLGRTLFITVGGITTCHKMRHSLSLPTVTYICMGELPHFHHSPTTSFLHSQPIQAPPSGPGLVCAAGQMFIWDYPSVTPLS